MPLLKGQPYRPTESLPAGLTRNHAVWVIHTTGEVFIDYELYLHKVRLYCEPVWTCTRTTRTGLTYLQAILSENAPKTEQEVLSDMEPLTLPLPALQMTLSSSGNASMDMELQLISPYLRNKARNDHVNVTPEQLAEVLAGDDGHPVSDVKKRRSSGKEGDQGRVKGDSKKILGTVKHTIYETLKWVGGNGASISYLHQRLKDCKIQTTWADSSARNCIASLLNHDKAFVKLPKHGHYALAEYVPETEPENEKRELPANENEAPEFQKNNGRCMKCLKTKRADSSPLVFCDQCPSAIHLSCAHEHEAAMRELDQNESGIQFPYLCYKCIQKRKMAERQKVVRQKREEQKLKKQEERSARQLENEERRRDIDRRRRNGHRSITRYPIEDSDLTDEDHRHKAELIRGPVLPDPHPNSQDLLDALTICEFLSVFGTELDDRLVAPDLCVAELMYIVCWPFDSSMLKNTYQALLKAAIHQTMRLPDAPAEVRHWNATLDGFTWPEILKFFLKHQGNHDIMEEIKTELASKGGDEGEALFLELSPRLHLKLLSLLMTYVSCSNLIRQAADGRLADAKKLESDISKMKREMNKAKAKNTSTAQSKEGPEGSQAVDKGSDENGDRRYLRRRGLPEESQETIAQNALSVLEEKLERCKVRCEAIGSDRHRNDYFWFPSLPECLCIISNDQSAVCCVRSKEELANVMGGLDIRGIREKHLLEALKEDYDNLIGCFAPREFSFDLNDITRGVPCTELLSFHKANKKHSRTAVDKLKVEHASFALKTMINRLHKILGGMASVDSDMRTDIKNVRFRLNCITEIPAMIQFIKRLSLELKRIFQDGTERANGKTQMRLTAHLDNLDRSTSMSLSELGFYIATLRDIVEPLVRTKSKAQHSMEAKRKRTERSISDRSSPSGEILPTKKIKQHHPSSGEEAETDLLPLMEVPWRVTRSHARKGMPVNHLDVIQDASTISEALTESESKDDVTDDDYEGGDESHEGGESTDDIVCRFCHFGGRLIRCSGDGCDVHVHRSCILGNKGSNIWYCSRCARTNRALYRNDRGS